MDPIVCADDLCEELHRPGPLDGSRLAQLARLLQQAGPRGLDPVLAEVGRRGYLDRLVPRAPSEGAARVWEALRAGLGGAAGYLALIEVLLRDKTKGEYAAWGLERLIQQAEDADRAAGRPLVLLQAVFAAVIRAGRYEQMVALLRSGQHAESPALRALALARPMHGRDELNGPAVALARRQERRGGSYDVLIVPGYTPPEAARPLQLEEIRPAVDRVKAALADYKAGLAPFVLVSGGSVYPSGTPYNEGLMMREFLLERGVPAERVLVDPHARHSTTNLRNAGRMMRALGLSRGLIVTGYERAMFSQQFYFANPTLSTFLMRCQMTLGYSVGELKDVDAHHVAYSPSAEVERPNYADPWDV